MSIQDAKELRNMLGGAATAAAILYVVVALAAALIGWFWRRGKR